MKSLTTYITEKLKEHTFLIWIDDLRNPKDPQWQSFIHNNFKTKFDDIEWCKNYDEFVKYLEHHGRPTGISFDHDLGDIKDDDEKSGYSCCKYFVNWLQDHDLDIPEYAIQSSNPAGTENIDGLMKNYHKFYTRTHVNIHESIQGLNGYTDEEVCDIVRDYCEEQLEDIDIEINEIWLHGSRLRGTAREDSDIDAVMFYKGSEKEDSLFNILHDEDNPCTIEDFEIDINPVQIRSKHDIDKYKKKSYDYDKDIISKNSK